MSSAFEQYRAQVGALAVDEFVHRHRHPFLLKRADSEGPVDREVRERTEMDEGPTSSTSARDIRAMIQSLEAERAERSSDRWLVLPLRPRTRAAAAATVTFVRGMGLKHSAGFGRSVPLVVGRSTQSDIVLPYASVSKTHAHILIGVDGAVSVIDQASRNGTYIDERRLAPGERGRLAAGAVLRLGNLRFEFVSARRLYEALLAHGPR